ncbi:MAG: phosphate acyltransferase PlsX [Synergistaceae bacterium]|jgi:glycerol-3-phosphate acyltransferase PlsX|nr:phosphate acyltransferase PlsX [Synergistaceae bacterium]
MLFALDAMGGDKAPAEPCMGAVLACEENAEMSVALVGRREAIEPHLEDASSSARSRIGIVEADEVIGMGDNPSASIRTKKNSSMRVAMEMVRAGEAVGCISAGNTGAIVAGGVLVVGRIRGIDRPGLAVPLPSLERPSLLLDVGATVRCKPLNLYQFARMGSIYMKSLTGVESPSVGLFSNGSEVIKGDEVISEAREMLLECGLNFAGFVEGKDVPLGRTDIVVCDGFTGNALIKFGEGIGELVKVIVREELSGKFLPKIGAALMMPALKKIWSRFEYEKNGGSPLLGVDGIVVKAHGNSSRRAIAGALRVASGFAGLSGTDLIKESFESRAGGAGL